jgi:hypothetical protein
VAQDNVETRKVVSIAPSDVPSAPTDVEEAPATAAANGINDSEFIAQLNKLRSLKSFLNNEAVVLAMPDSDTKALGDLFTLTLSFRGRSPTGSEWAELDKFSQLFFQRLTESQRRRFLLGGIPEAFARLPFIFAGTALLSLLGSALLPNLLPLAAPDVFSILPCYLLWLISLGAIGSIAFIGMNALSVQQDITFDLLNARLINLRVALGALFALVLTLPFGYDGFLKFISALSLMNRVTVTNSGNEAMLSTKDAVTLIMPFLLGFSTSLVIMILNRMLEATQSFFGKTLITTAPSTSGPVPPTAFPPANTSGTGSGRSKGSKANRAKRPRAPDSAPSGSMSQLS